MKFLRYAMMIVAASCATASSSARAQSPQRLVKMEYEATLLEVDDPLGIFPEVRTGDPVRGTIMYDPLSDALLLLQPVWLNAVTMIVENPRGGPETQFLGEEEGSFGFVLNDVEDDQLGEADGFLLVQPVAAPPGFTGEAPVVMVNFLAPASQFADFEATFPDEIVLEEWPFAIVMFFDFGDFVGEEGSGTGLAAEIHTLRSVPIGRGDFDGNGVVDDGDLAIWQEDFGSVFDGGPFGYVPFADADLDGDADGNDFLVWQQNLSLVAATGGSAVFVPEPSGRLLALVSLAALPLVRRPQFPKVPAIN